MAGLISILSYFFIPYSSKKETVICQLRATRRRATKSFLLIIPFSLYHGNPHEKIYWFLENPVLWAGSESIGYAENMIKGV
jgi:hypothetical protein